MSSRMNAMASAARSNSVTMPPFTSAVGARDARSKRNRCCRARSCARQWIDDASAIHCLAQDRARQHLVRFDLASRAPTALVKGGMVTEFDLAADAIAFIRDDMNTPPSVYAKRGD